MAALSDQALKRARKHRARLAFGEQAYVFLFFETIDSFDRIFWNAYPRSDLQGAAFFLTGLG
jgi:hypothetical protein